MDAVRTMSSLVSPVRQATTHSTPSWTDLPPTLADRAKAISVSFTAILAANVHNGIEVCQPHIPPLLSRPHWPRRSGWMRSSAVIDKNPPIQEPSAANST
jgi:hypothetical protein